MNMSRNSLCALSFHAENELEDRISGGYTTSNPGPFGIEAAGEKALVKSGHVTPQIMDIA